MADNTKYYTVDDQFGSPKLIRTNADGCEILNYLFPNGPWRKAKYSNPYPIGSGERLVECKKSDWDKAIKKYKSQKVII